MLSESDLELLKPGQWLNDAVLGCAFEYLTHGHPRTAVPHLVFLSPAMVHLARAVPADSLRDVLGELCNALAGCAAAFFPLSDASVKETEANAGTHWTLLAFVRDGGFFHLDSLGGDVPRAAKDLAAALAPLASADAKVQARSCPRQENSTDCGLHVALNAERLAEAVLDGDHLKARLATAEEAANHRKTLRVSGEGNGGGLRQREAEAKGTESSRSRV